jgi:hypothetical protein
MAPRILSAYPITLYVIFGMAVVSWVIALKYFLVVNRELMRLYQTGEGNYLPRGGGRGIPIAILITKNAMPRVEKERRKCVYAIACFIGLCFAGALLIDIFGPIS